MDEIYEADKYNCTENSADEKSELFYQDIIMEKANQDAIKRKYQIDDNGKEIKIAENHMMR